MNCTIKHTAVLGDRVNTIYIDAPCRGVFYCTAKDFTIVPRVVEEGVNDVIALRHGKLMEIVEGEVVGVVCELKPFTLDELIDHCTELAQSSNLTEEDFKEIVKETRRGRPKK